MTQKKENSKGRNRRELTRTSAEWRYRLWGMRRLPDDQHEKCSWVQEIREEPKIPTAATTADLGTRGMTIPVQNVSK